jgi:hypothetical protein
MKKKHLYLKAADAYSIAMLAKQIWREEWDKDLLPDAMCFIGFELKLKGSKTKTPRQRLQNKVIHFGCFDAVDVTSF